LATWLMETAAAGTRQPGTAVWLRLHQPGDGAQAVLLGDASDHGHHLDGAQQLAGAATVAL
jgi:hypothetical protein